MFARWMLVLLLPASLLFVQCDKDDDSDEPRESPEEAYARLEANNTVTSATWDENGMLKELYGTFNPPEPSSDPAENVYRFLDEYKAAFRMRNPRSEFEVHHVTGGDIPFVRMNQYYYGVPVDYGTLGVLYYGSEMRMIAVDYYADLSMSTTPTLSLQAAFARAQAIADTQAATVIADTSQYILSIYNNPYAEITGPLLSWQVVLYCDGFFPWLYVIDAQTGAYITRYELWVE